MANNRFAPKPARFGIETAYLVLGNPGPIAPVAVASSTVTYRIGTPKRRLFVETASVLMGTLPTGSLAITAQVFKRNSVGALNQAITGTFDLKAGVAALTVALIPITATDAQRSLKEGDYLAVDIVAAGTITQQPVDLFIPVEVAVLE